MFIHCLYGVSIINFCYIYITHICSYFLCNFSCLYFNCFDIFMTKKSENIEYLTHLKNKNKNEGSGGDHYPYLIHFKKMGVINKGT